MFSYEFCEISKNTFFTEQLCVIASRCSHREIDNMKTSKNNQRKYSLKQGVLKIFSTVKWKHLSQCLFQFICRPQDCNFIKKETPIKYFPVKLVNFFTEHLWATASRLLNTIFGDGYNSITVRLMEAFKITPFIFKL